MHAHRFCTIEPNIAKVSVPDSRLEKLFELVGSEKLIPTQIEFTDIAGLVRGGMFFISNMIHTYIYVCVCVLSPSLKLIAVCFPLLHIIL